MMRNENSCDEKSNCPSDVEIAFTRTLLQGSAGTLLTYWLDVLYVFSVGNKKGPLKLKDLIQTAQKMDQNFK